MVNYSKDPVERGDLITQKSMLYKFLTLSTNTALENRRSLNKLIYQFESVYFKEASSLFFLIWGVLNSLTYRHWYSLTYRHW